MDAKSYFWAIQLNCFSLQFSWLNTLHCLWALRFVNRKKGTERTPGLPPARTGRNSAYTFLLPAHFTLPFAPNQYEIWGNGWEGEGNKREEGFISSVKGSLPGTGYGEEKVEEPVPAYPQRTAAYSCLLPWATKAKFTFSSSQGSFAETHIPCQDQNAIKTASRIACSQGSWHLCAVFSTLAFLTTRGGEGLGRVAPEEGRTYTLKGHRHYP